jgi:hypothetical protein
VSIVDYLADVVTVNQGAIKHESRGSGRSSVLLLQNINAIIDEAELERRNSAASLASASSAGSLKRRFSWDRNQPYLDKISIHFDEQQREC